MTILQVEKIRYAKFIKTTLPFSVPGFGFDKQLSLIKLDSFFNRHLFHQSLQIFMRFWVVSREIQDRLLTCRFRFQMKFWYQTFEQNPSFSNQNPSFSMILIYPSRIYHDIGLHKPKLCPSIFLGEIPSSQLDLLLKLPLKDLSFYLFFFKPEHDIIVHVARTLALQLVIVRHTIKSKRWVRIVSASRGK